MMMGRTCDTKRRNEKVIQDFGWRNGKEEAFCET
jgi:hypothetical protein